MATTAFDDADRWAWDRIGKLGGDLPARRHAAPEAARPGLVSNAFVLDEERLVRYSTLARQTQREDMLAAVLKGASLEAFALKLTDLPSASDEGAGLAMLSGKR